MGRQTFEVRGTYLGERVIPNFVDLPFWGNRPNHSYCYFCPKCGDIWGRLRHEGSAYWQVSHRNCEDHGDGRLAQPFLGDPTGLEKDWPHDAVLREFLLELRMAENGR